MNTILIPVVIAINAFFSPVTSNIIPVAQKSSKTQPAREKIHSVNEGDSLSSIANKYYGDSSHWTTVWNDNPSIEDPSIIIKGQLIKIRLKKPENPEKLKEELNNRLITISEYKKYQSEKITSNLIQGSVNMYSQGPLTESQLEFLGNCESGMTATKNSGNGYYGAFQFSQGTWNRMNTGYPRADMAPLEVQKDAVQKLVSKSNIFGQFPSCSRKMRTQGLI